MMLHMPITKNIKSRLIDALISAFTFAAALAWRETLLQVINRFLPQEDNTLWSEVLVTLMLTAIVIMLIFFLLKSDELVDHKFYDQENHEDNERKNDNKKNK